MTPRLCPNETGFLGQDHQRNEQRTWMVVALTAATMVLEIVAGTLFGSMALVADGWHMATHAGALAVAGLAYFFARRHVRDRRFAFGTAKMGDLAAFASAILLGVVALWIAWEATDRLLAPVPIAFDEALVVAVFGLLVNLVSAALLHQGNPGPGHSQSQAPPHHHGGHHHGARHHGAHHHGHATVHSDMNLRTAYAHVAADALTSVAAILALLAGRTWGWIWLDGLMALVGATVIALWAVGLIRESGAILLDMVPDTAQADAIRAALEQGGDSVTDLHLWRLGPGHLGLAVTVSSSGTLTAEQGRARLQGFAQLSHVTMEISGAVANP